MKRLLIGLWLIIATVGLSQAMLFYPDAFPRPPQKLAIWLTQLFQTENAEDIAVVEELYTLLVSCFLVGLLTALVLRIRSSLRKPVES